MAFVFIFNQPASAQETPVAGAASDKQNVQITSKDVTGEIVGLSGNFIAVAGGVNPKTGAVSEAAFNLGKNVKVVHKRSLSEFGVGDVVKVEYEEKIVSADNGRKMRSTTVTSLTFLKPAARDLSSQEEIPQTQPETESRPDTESLSLKGERGR